MAVVVVFGVVEPEPVRAVLETQRQHGLGALHREIPLHRELQQRAAGLDEALRQLPEGHLGVEGVDVVIRRLGHLGLSVVLGAEPRDLGPQGLVRLEAGGEGRHRPVGEGVGAAEGGLDAAGGEIIALRHRSHDSSAGIEDRFLLL